jgi:hypothetical protein
MKDDILDDDRSLSSPPISDFVVRYGLMSGGAMVAFQLLTILLDMSANNSMSWIGYGLSAAFVVLAIRAYKTDNGGYVSFGKAFGLGFLVSMLSSFIAGAFVYVYYEWVDPSGLEVLIAQAREQLEQDPRMNEELIEESMVWVKKTITPMMMLLLSLGSGIVGGSIISAIAGAIFKK